MSAVIFSVILVPAGVREEGREWGAQGSEVKGEENEEVAPMRRS